MTINRHNYEEFFLLYVDNELAASERRAVEDFVKENPDLAGELQMFQDTVLHPEAAPVLPGKENLLRGEGSPVIDEANCEAYFIQYADNELDVAMQARVEDFVYHHPEQQANFELYQQIKMTPDNLIVFPHKESLYRQTGGDRVLVMRWWRMAAAAAVLLMLASFTWYMLNGRQGNGADMANTTPDKGQESISPAPKSVPETAVTQPQQNLALNPASQTDADNPLAAAHAAASRKIPAAETAPGRNRLADNVKMADIAKSETAEPAQSGKTENNPDNGSNLRSSSSVPLIETNVAQVDVPKATPSDLETASAKTDWNVSFDELDKNDKQPEALYASNEGDGSEVNASGNKTRMRGIFRKLSRVVEKATGGASDDRTTDGKGVRIASFEIALK